MKVENPGKIITNLQALQWLREETAEYDGSDGTGRAREMPENLRIIMRDTMNYLEHPDRPSAAVLAKRPTRGSKTIFRGSAGLVGRLFAFLHPERLNPHDCNEANPTAPFCPPKGGWRLTKAEAMQIYNLRPKTLLELDLILEEAGNRFTDEELQGILEIIEKTFEEHEDDIPKGDEIMRENPDAPKKEE